MSPEGEVFRQAVRIEHSHGLLHFGLDRRRIRELFERYPYDNFSWVLVDFTKRVLTREPWTLVHGIFF
jgi:hypothetical protein